MSQDKLSNALKVGSMLLEFKILDVLGQGGFGITYKVLDTTTNNTMVIKEYMPSQFATRDSNQTTVSYIHQEKDLFEWGLKRFIEEAKLLKQFSHINIVKGYKFFKTNKTAYFVMDFYKGKTLATYLSQNRGKKFDRDEILYIMMPILEGLKEVHQKGFLHRDIAPDNIYLRDNDSSILIDFGASRNALAVKSQTISAIVKAGYSPPEQYTSSSRQNETTDLYAISAVIYEMITGNKPSESSHRQTEVFGGNNDPIEDIVSNYSDIFSISFLETVVKGLNLRQQDRIQSIEEVQDR